MINKYYQENNAQNYPSNKRSEESEDMDLKDLTEIDIFSKKYGFNEEYKRLADFDQFFRMYLDNRIFKYVDVDVAYFSTDGVSQKNNIALAIEREKIHKKLGISRKKRIRRWVRYFFICVIKDNRLFYKCFFGIDYWIQKIKNIH